MRVKLTIFLIILFLMVSYFQHQYDSRINYYTERETFVAIPSGKTLKILSFGYSNLMADLLLIWSIQFYSSYHLSNRYDYIEHIFNVITDIAPQYQEPYIVGSWIMALEKKDYKMAIRLLNKGSRNMPDEYLFDYEAAYYSYKNLNDFEAAEKLFKRASEKPNAPKLLARSRAHMVYMQDDLDYAWSLWMDIAKNAKTIVEKDAAYNHLYQIKYEKDKKNIVKQSKRFKEKYGRYPRDLGELLRAGFIKEIPADYQGNQYTYNPVNGTIKAVKEFRWKKS